MIVFVRYILLKVENLFVNNIYVLVVGMEIYMWYDFFCGVFWNRGILCVLVIVGFLVEIMCLLDFVRFEYFF